VPTISRQDRLLPLISADKPSRVASPGKNLFAAAVRRSKRGAFDIFNVPGVQVPTVGRNSSFLSRGMAQMIAPGAFEVARDEAAHEVTRPGLRWSAAALRELAGGRRIGARTVML